MEQQEVRALAQRFIDALARLEHEGLDALDDLVALFAEDATVVNPALENAGEARAGRDEIKRFWTTYREVLGDAQSRFSQITTNEEAAGLFWSTHASAGGGLQYDGATLLVFDGGGLITQFRAYFDPSELPHETRGSGNVEHDAAADAVVHYG